jgi:hypothetical protein
MDAPMPSKLPVLLALLLLAGLLFAAGAGHAATGPLTIPLALEEEPEYEEEGEYEESECEIAEVEFELGELEQAEMDEICAEEASKSKRGKGSTAPEECILRSAHGHAAINDKSNKLKLTIGYTAYEPVGAKVKVGNLATVKRQLGRSGVLRFVKALGEKEPKRLVINIKLPSVKRAGCPSRRLVLFPK